MHELAQTAPADTSAKNEDALELARVRESQAALTRTLHEERFDRLRGARHRRERQEARRELDRALEHEDRRRYERERLDAVAAAGLRTDHEWIRQHHDEVSTWRFALYRASHDDYEDSLLPSGMPAGSPEEALDCACGLYLGDPTAWLPDTPTN